MSVIESIWTYMAGLGHKQSSSLTGIVKSLRVNTTKQQPTTKYPFNPRFRAYGKARIDVTQRAKSELDWQAMWHEPFYPFPFRWEGAWRPCIEYTVDNFAAEVGFYLDFMGFQVTAFSPIYAQFTTPDQDYFFAISSVQEEQFSTDPDTLRFQFVLQELEETIDELERRGIDIQRWRRPLQDGALEQYAYLRSPHGVRIELWGRPEPEIDEEEVALQRIIDDLQNEHAKSDYETSEVDEEEGNLDVNTDEDLQDDNLEDDEISDESEYEDEDLEYDDEDVPQSMLEEPNTNKELDSPISHASRRPQAYPTRNTPDRYWPTLSSHKRKPYTQSHKPKGGTEMSYLPLDEDETQYEDD